MEKVTIYDYARMCKFYKNCNDCALAKSTAICQVFIEEHPDEANEIILKWCEEHPIKTRQSELLKMFPNAKTNIGGVLSICPQLVNKDFSCQTSKKHCSGCCKEYWLAEVDE